MPLPAADSDWPPKPFDQVHRVLGEWSAWYSGDPAQLVNQYNNSIQDVASRTQFYGGIVGWVARLFWGTPAAKGATNTSKIHVPLAEDIAAEGGKQLFKNPPRISVISTEHQEQIERFIDNGMFKQLLHAAELGSALGDVYIRVGYDLDVSDLPINTIHPSDLVIPSFRYGQLQTALIWRELADENGEVWRHFEYHELGWIHHRLFVGSKSNLGKNVPLSQRGETRGLQEITATNLNELDVIHVPNLHTRLWRKLGEASHLGRSDFGAPGIITLMDALDETYTSLMRDIRLSKYRLIVSQSYLESAGRGKEATFNIDQEVFVGLNVPGMSDDLKILPTQGDIRVEKLLQAVTGLTKEIVSGSGYSAQTFGLTGEVAMTATEANARERKTADTRDIKIESWKPAMKQYCRLNAKTMVLMGKGTPPPDDYLIEFPPFAEKSEREVAESIQMLANANAISIEEKVRMRKPDWDDDRINVEVQQIQPSVVAS